MDGLEKLNSIGVSKIHSDTHISVKNLQALIHGSFEELNRVQVLGFISILEREYKVDLSELRDKANEYFKNDVDIEKNILNNDEEVVLFMPKKSGIKNFLIIVLTLFFVVVLYYFGLSSENNDEIVLDKNETKKEKNISTAYNQLEEIEDNQSKIVEKKTIKSLKIIPRQKVWIGVIELDGLKKKQFTTTSVLELNTSKDYLISLGHGYVDIEVDDNLTTLKDPYPVRFIYKDSKLSKISIEEFKRYNKGRIW